MSLEILTALAAFAFVSSITPGPNNLMLMTSGANYGFQRSMPHMLGVCIGFTIMIVLVGTGLMSLFDAFPASYKILKIFSLVYLLYLAWKIATAKPVTNNDISAGKTSANGKPLSFIQAALFQWVNPKAWTMALTAISVYTPELQPLTGVLIVAMVFGLINLPSVTTWVVLGTQLSRFLSNNRRLRIFNCSAALLLIASLYPVVFG